MLTLSFVDFDPTETSEGIRRTCDVALDFDNSRNVNCLTDLGFEA
jgi:hypothetical protein